MIPLIGALVIGITLGLLGSGGSILTVPVLVYLLGHEDKVAIAESLAIVGAISFVGIFPYAGTRQVDWRSVLFFGVPGMIGTYGGAWLAHLVSGTAQLVLFAAVMLLASLLMFRGSRESSSPEEEAQAANRKSPSDARHPLWQIALEGIVVGILTGLVGVGGGFLIVPALVILGGLPMRRAVGTSLAIIALKSAAGLYKYLGVLSDLDLSVDWSTVALFIAVGIIGSLVGKAVSSRINQLTLQRVFAGFLVVMGVAVLFIEAPKLLQNRAASSTAETTSLVDTLGD